MRVALVHDYLTQYGGAERVLDVLVQGYPDATIHTSFYDPAAFPATWNTWRIKESPIARLPGARRTHRAWIPLYPAIFGAIGQSLTDVDVVIADSSAWSHHAHPPDGIPLIVYCHSPARFLHSDRHYLGATKFSRLATPALGPAFHGLRALDRRAARRATRVIANSATVAERVRRVWGIDATVVYPPVDVERFRPATAVQAEDWMLVVSRLVPHKWIDRAVRACTRANVPLKVIGAGRARKSLEAIAGPTVTFVDAQPDHIVVDHMQRCRALILPGVEDFGMTAVEAQGAGRPVLAARGGGALETVVHGETGLLWDIEDPEGLDRALAEATTRRWDSDAIMAHAGRFSRQVFLDGIRREVRTTLASSR